MLKKQFKQANLSASVSGMCRSFDQVQAQKVVRDGRAMPEYDTTGGSMSAQEPKGSYLQSQTEIKIKKSLQN